MRGKYSLTSAFSLESNTTVPLEPYDREKAWGCKGNLCEHLFMKEMMFPPGGKGQEPGVMSLLGHHIRWPPPASEGEPPPRALFFDLGTNRWETSMEPMLGRYPLAFDVAFGWEASSEFFFASPPNSFHKSFETNYHRPRPKTALFPSFVDVSWGKKAGCKSLQAELAAFKGDDRSVAKLQALAMKSMCDRVDWPAFLNATARPMDLVVVKMDIEGLEYRVLDQLEQRGLAHLVDELFVELHFDRLKKGVKGQPEAWYNPARRSYPGRVFYQRDSAEFSARWREMIPAFHLWA